MQQQAPVVQATPQAAPAVSSSSWGAPAPVQQAAPAPPAPAPVRAAPAPAPPQPVMRTLNPIEQVVQVNTFQHNKNLIIQRFI